LTEKGFQVLPGGGLAGLFDHFSRVSQTQCMGRARLHAGGPLRSAVTKVAFECRTLFPSADLGGCHMNGPERTDHHAQAATDTPLRIHGGVGGRSVRGAGWAYPNTGRIFALPALGGQFDCIDLHHSIAPVNNAFSDRKGKRAALGKNIPSLWARHEVGHPI
jgi:hypothetical protein